MKSAFIILASLMMLTAPAMAVGFQHVAAPDPGEPAGASTPSL